MTTPISFQTWSEQIFIFIWYNTVVWQFFQIFVYGDVVNAQTWDVLYITKYSNYSLGCSFSFFFF